MPSFLFVLLLLSIKDLYVLSMSADSAFLDALRFISNLRECDIQSEHVSIKLPELTSYATVSTSNVTVNKILEKEYIEFWQEMRKRDYEKDRNRLDVISKGAALSSTVAPEASLASSVFADVPASAEVSLLLPLMKGDLLQYRRRIASAKEGNLFDSLNKVLRTNSEYSEVEKELVLSAATMLDIAGKISKCSRAMVTLNEFDALRSDGLAFECIRDWDRNTSSLKILYLTFILHARKLIAHVSNTLDGAKTIAAMQADLERIIQTELPLNLITEVGREVNNTHTFKFSEDHTAYQESIDAVHLIFVKDSRKLVNSKWNANLQRLMEDQVSLFYENHIVYVSVAESFGKSFTDGWKSLLDEIMQIITEDDVTIEENPMNFVF